MSLRDALGAAFEGAATARACDSAGPTPVGNRRDSLKAPGVVQGEGGVKQGESLKDSGNGKIGEQIWGTNRGRNPMSFGDVKGVVPSLKRNRFLPLKIGELESRGFRAWKPSLFRGRFLQDLCMWIYMSM